MDHFVAPMPNSSLKLAFSLSIQVKRALSIVETLIVCTRTAALPPAYRLRLL
jgi:hypothetical protein